MLIYLIFGHYLGDFALQNDFVAKFKAPGSAPFWFHVMTGHCAIHAGIVFMATHNPVASVGEFIAHFLTDSLKCKGTLSFNQDQLIHIVCKIIWWRISL
jgi:hypothetical protein